jgi:hypothetical protein
MANNSDPNTSWTVLVGFIGTVLMIVTVFALQALYHSVENREFAEKVLDQRPEELMLLRNDQIENLSTYRWVNKASGVVAIPIELAMDLVVRDEMAKPGPAVEPPPATPIQEGNDESL